MPTTTTYSSRMVQRPDNSSQYYSQAAQEIDAAIAGGRAVNAGARNRVVSEYANYLKQLDANSAADQSSMQAAQQEDRSRMASILAARGLGGDGGAQFNYGRLNAQHEGAKASILAKYAQERGNLLTKQGSAVGEIDAQDDALMAARQAKIGELARLLEDRGWSRETQLEQLALQREANAYARAQNDLERSGQKAAEDAAKDALFKENLRIGYFENGNGWSELDALAKQYGKDLTQYLYMLPGLEAPNPDAFNRMRYGMNNVFGNRYASIAPVAQTPHGASLVSDRTVGPNAYPSRNASIPSGGLFRSEEY